MTVIFRDGLTTFVPRARLIKLLGVSAVSSPETD